MTITAGEKIYPTIVCDVRGQEFLLHPEKVLYWPAQKLLVVSDLHLGKDGHFRKNGIPIPGAVTEADLYRLEKLIDTFYPERVLFLGDLFHSSYNQSWQLLVKLIAGHSEIEFLLVKGNHDILEATDYVVANLSIHETVYQIDQFIFSHHPLDDLPKKYYCIAGHIHPAVVLRGQGMQSMTVPCFYFGASQALMPAFGGFTGVAKVYPRKEDQVFGVFENEIIKLQ